MRFCQTVLSVSNAPGSRLYSSAASVLFYISTVQSLETRGKYSRGVTSSLSASVLSCHYVVHFSLPPSHLFKCKAWV